MLKTAIWWVTWACNYHCEYCWQVQGQRVGEYKPDKMTKDSPNKWLEAWQRLRPEAIAITGGEPFLMPGLVDVLWHLQHFARIGITTNLSREMIDFADRLNPDRFTGVTISLHPSQKEFNEAVFFSRAMMLRNRGFPVVVNFVGWPEQLWMAAHYKQLCLERGFGFHFDPYGSAYRHVNWSPRELAEIERLRDSDRTPHPLTVLHGEGVAVNCSGGVDHLSVMPNGDAYRCIDDQQRKVPSLGNVFDANFRLNAEPTRCERLHFCAGCDRDHVTVELVT